MEFLFYLFDGIFKAFQSLEVSMFTGIYLTVQVLVFMLLIAVHLFTKHKERQAMGIVRKELLLLREQNVDEMNLNIKINSIFQTVSPNSNYAKQWNRYYDRITKKKPGEKIRTEPFFGLEAMYSAIGQRHILDFGGGIHTSLGVLGTFIGLSMGLSGLNVLDSEALRIGIGGLIGGMQVAFYTSVLGVVLSIIWIFVDRFISKGIEAEIEWHSNELALLLNADDEEIFLNRLEKITQQQSDQLKTVLTDALEHVMQPFVQTVQQGNNTIHSSFGKMHEQLREQADTSKEHLALLKNQSYDVTEKLIGSITNETQETIGQFTEMMNISRQTQTDMLNSVQHVVAKLEIASMNQEKLFSRTENIVESFSSLSKGIESTQESYDQSFSDLSNLASTLREIQQLNLDQIPVQQAIMTQNSEFMNKSGNLVSSFEQFGNDLQQMQSTLLDELVEKATIVSSRFEELSKQLSNASQQYLLSSRENNTLIDLTKESIITMQPIVKEMNEAASSLDHLSAELRNTQEIQNELTPHLSKWNDEVLDYLRDFVSLSETSLLENTKQIQYSKEQWESTSRDFEATRSELSGSLKEFTRNIESGVTTTFQLFDKELVTVVNNFKSMSEAYTESQDEMTDAMRKFIDTLNEHKVEV
ncbi:MotA/TolQ/ExbB proton channel family protein [Psychrobacillus sp. MER TA 171]|uniref:MotA/TolQ/ExbB proton channel family protein n=1 Tax=Psychrobacillus sp. MER TA 171 TaxID=2939577 RepID=UPI00203FA30A|nr:MotA/TolQ/ExbB proton channel family protein [Psychrobacillus sp. MER TA 171]MCM3359231.1 MotA/TolQ/ExbB proton channel family protein [Psychrobacillus sp. MER TA 171]